MPYLSSISQQQFLAIDLAGDQSQLTLTNLAGGELRSQKLALATGAWLAAPEVFAREADVIVRLQTAGGPVFARVSDETIAALSEPPALDGATPIAVKPPQGDAPFVAAPAMPAAVAAQSAPAAPTMPGGLPTAPAAPTMPGGLPTAPAAPTMPGGLPPAPAAPTMPGGLPAAPAAPTMATMPPVMPAAPTMPGGLPPAPVAPTMPGGLPPASAAPAPMPEAADPFSAVLEAITARREHPALPFVRWGGITILVIVLNLLNANLLRDSQGAQTSGSGAVALAALLTNIWWAVTTITTFYPPLTRLFMRLARRIAGARGSGRESLVISLVGGLLIFVFICFPFSLVSSSEQTTGVIRTLDLLIYPLICVALVYVLLDKIVNWRETGNTASTHLIDGLAPQVNAVYARVVEQMAERGLPKPYKAELVSFEEQGFLSWSEYKQVRQLHITYDRARVILRVVPYGNDLYVRWESYFDFSMRRLAYVTSLAGEVLVVPPQRFLGVDLVEAFSTLFLSSRDSTGGRELSASSLPFGQFFLGLNWNYLPSSMIDDLQSLEGAVTGSAQDVLNELMLTAGREERVQVAVDRTRSRYRRLF